MKFYNHINIEIGILDPKNLLLDMFHYFHCQLQIKTCKFIEFWPPYWILVAILNFNGHVIIEIEFLDHENLLIDIFHYFLCQLETEISKFIEFWWQFFILAAILFLSLGQLGPLLKCILVTQTTILASWPNFIKHGKSQLFLHRNSRLLIVHYTY